MGSYVRAPVGAGASDRLCQVIAAPAGRERGWLLLVLRNGDSVRAPEKWLQPVDEKTPEVAAEIAAHRAREERQIVALELAMGAL